MSAGENFSCSYSPAGFTASRRSSSPAAICPADTLSGYSSYRRSPDGAAHISRPPEWHMPCFGRQTRWDNAVRERCGQAPCTRRRTAPKCGRRILRSIKSVLIIQYDLLIPRDIERLRQRSAAEIVRAPAPRGDARKSVCPDRENSITAPRRGNMRPCPAENKTSCAPVSAAGTRFSPAEPLFLCGGRVFRLNFT